MNKKTCLEVVGGLSVPSKLPCYSYSIPADKCKTGGKLRNIEGSVCNKCYAHKGFYKLYPAVGVALQRRFDKLKHPKWVESMSFLINSYKEGYFRWHDSGDIQDIEHLKNIVEVCKNTPNTLHWLPTKEIQIITEYVKSGLTFPDNLIVRISNFMVESNVFEKLANKLGVYTSGVSKKNYNCKAPQQENQCKDCRMCWNKNIKHVIYHAH